VKRVKIRSLNPSEIDDAKFRSLSCNGVIHVYDEASPPAMHRTQHAISKRTCGSPGVKVNAVWSGNFERGEIVSPVGSIASKVSV